MGFFITVEGGEGSGKSSFAQILKNHLESLGKSVLLTREPGGTFLAEKLRDLFIHPGDQEEWTPEASFFLVSASRAQHVEKTILPALQSGKWVICDRFFDSSFVYQGILGGTPLFLLEAVESLWREKAFPTVSCLMDCPVDLAFQRVSSRLSQPNRYDQANQEVFQIIRQAFLKRAHGESRWVIVNSEDPMDLAFEKAWPQILRRCHQKQD